MAGLEEFMWRSTIKWSDLIATAQSVISRWNTITDFVVVMDTREHIWTVRHSSVAAPFLVLAEDSMRGSVPRIGNPMPFLLLLGMAVTRPGCVELSFANGQKIDPGRFELNDLTALLPHATHPVHRKLAQLAVMATPATPADTQGRS
ncbi:hypothetical protein [Uliginosibacterium gangwonense]|uniref:hypothetical protein n=1 Tax=Uliginosibacterium gangwonense TaxID=392736 RepID=UPI000382BA19|nr:hypothetical protein [Uliginosibacterium gangwonense]